MANICNVRIGNTATEIAVSWAGAKVGAKVGAAFGAFIGVHCLFIGVVPATIIGGAIGAIAGGFGGPMLFNYIRKKTGI